MGDKIEIGAVIGDSSQMAKKMKWALNDDSYYELGSVHRETLE